MMAVNVGTMLVLHLQSGPGLFALRGAVGGADGAGVRRGRHGLAPPARLRAPSAACCRFRGGRGHLRGLAALLRFGQDGGGWFLARVAVLGVGMSLSYKPVPARAPAQVRSGGGGRRQWSAGDHGPVRHGERSGPLRGGLPRTWGSPQGLPPRRGPGRHLRGAVAGMLAGALAGLLAALAGPSRRGREGARGGQGGDR